MKQQTTTTALYCRLSKDDLINGDSMSIQNQKELLGNYASQNGFPITEFYVDDGYSGTNFERPSFKRMISDIEDGRIGTVIVKDLSRLGREYLQTGYFTEMFFPQNDVRFIAINDNVDSSEGYNDFAPFKNLINEWYHLLLKTPNSKTIRNHNTFINPPANLTAAVFIADTAAVIMIHCF